MTTHAQPIVTWSTRDGETRKAVRAGGLVHAAGSVAALRAFSSLAWLISALVGKDAKLAPSFLSGAGLAERIHETFVHSAILPAISAFLVDVVVPHAPLFAVLIAFGDLAVGISLSLGFLTRLGGAVAIFRALTNVAIGGGLGMDTIGFNALLAFAGVVAIVTGAGRLWGIDGWLRHEYPDNRVLRFLS
jgi:uncharacterized membrane protein YphA (DoxX/SURF4 family)